MTRLFEIAKSTSSSLKAAMQNLQDTLSFRPEVEEKVAIAIGRPSGLDSFFYYINDLAQCFFCFKTELLNFMKETSPRRASLYNHKILPTKVYEAWRGILSINYQSIYKPATDVLKIMLDNVDIKATAYCLTTIADTADKNRNSVPLGLFDIGGELFQEVISDRDDAASYYTKPTIAEFLSRDSCP